MTSNNTDLNPSKVLVTGGAGFIGSALVRYLINDLGLRVLNIDKLTYAGNLESLKSIEQNQNYTFLQADICDQNAMQKAFAEFQPDVVMHLAAESHVDRSIDGAAEFVQTNVVGTFTLLEVAREYWNNLYQAAKQSFRFHHISTDEVYGDLEGTSDLFTETNSYKPSSPYSASKAGSDHLVRAWYRTYGLPVVITNCSNNYGPYQFPEKLIPLMILNALEGKQLPVYGEGKQIRDWLYVDDHVEALWQVVTKGKLGETYNIGGHNEKQNIEVVHAICELLEELAPYKFHHPDSPHRHPDLEEVNRGAREAGLGHSGSTRREVSTQVSFKSLITHVQDRPGHDLRYAINASKIEHELGWRPKQTFETGLRQTVEWYLSNTEWVQHVQDGSYQRERLGVSNSEKAMDRVTKEATSDQKVMKA